MDSKNTVMQIPVEDIVPNRFQPRLAFDSASIKELADSIKEHGIIQPLVVRRVNDKYEIIAGERRYRGAKEVGLLTVPAIISNLTDEKSAEVAIVENVQRKDLTAIEEAKSYKVLLDKGLMTQEDLARKMGLSQSAISNKLRLLTLTEDVQDAILNEKISERHARSLLKIEDQIQQNEFLNRILNERLTVKMLEEEIKKIIEAKTVPEVVEPKIEELKNDFINLTDVEPKMPSKFFNFSGESSIQEAEEEIEMLDDFIVPVIKESNLEKIKKDLKKYTNIFIDETSEGDNTILTIKIPK